MNFSLRWAFAVFDTPILWNDPITGLITNRQTNRRDFLSSQVYLDEHSAFLITVGIDKHRHSIMGIDEENKVAPRHSDDQVFTIND